MTVASNRYSRSRVVLRKKGVIIHTSESGDSSHDSLISVMSRPGTRPVDGSNPPTFYGSSYHAIANAKTGTYTQVLGADCGPFSAPPLNKDYWHICMPGYSAQTREQWLDVASSNEIQAVAQFIVDKSGVDGFPPIQLTSGEIGAGRHGYCGHRDVTYGFHIAGGHTDPGVGFPWDVLAQRILALLMSPPQPPAPPVPPVPPVPQPGFDPANRHWGIWPAIPKPRTAQGATGDHVRYLQGVYRAVGLGGTVDGVFGPNTDRRTRDYQKAHGFVVDGIVGTKQTWPAIDADARKHSAQ